MLSKIKLTKMTNLNISLLYSKLFLIFKVFFNIKINITKDKNILKLPRIYKTEFS